jgi:hypothetical protein
LPLVVVESQRFEVECPPWLSLPRIFSVLSVPSVVKILCLDELEPSTTARVAFARITLASALLKPARDHPRAIRAIKLISSRRR